MLSEQEKRPPTVEDKALYIYTSGTTGLPKAANISHARAMQWGHWFAGMMGAQATDRMYNCLPMYHSVGGVQAPGAMLVAGGPSLAGEVFRKPVLERHCRAGIAPCSNTSASFAATRCTPRVSGRDDHRIRMACGNGLAPEVWDGFKNRFSIPQIFGFYASTEGGVSLFNSRASVGPSATSRLPDAPVLARAGGVDVEKGEPVRTRGILHSLRCK